MSQQTLAAEVRLSTEEDGAFLRRLFHDVHTPEFLLLGLPEQGLATLLDMQYRAQSSGFRMQFPLAVDHIVETEGRTVGRILVATEPEHLHLIDVALLACARGRGTGSFLLRLLTDHADLRGVPVRLMVRHGNPALRLYKRHGFLPIGDDGMNLRLERPAPAPLETTEAQFRGLLGRNLLALGQDGSTTELVLSAVRPFGTASSRSFCARVRRPGSAPVAVGHGAPAPRRHSLCGIIPFARERARDRRDLRGGLQPHAYSRVTSLDSGAVITSLVNG